MHVLVQAAQMLRHGFMDILCKLPTNVRAVLLSATEPADTQDPFRITVKKEEVRI